MKKLSFLALAAAGLMLGACSSDKDDVASSPETAQQIINGTGKGYIAVNINLPSAPSAASTRAANDNFDDGLPAEYDVKSAILMLFSGSTPDDATWLEDIDIYSQLKKFQDADNDNITTSYQVAAKVNNTVTGNLYGLVLLNYTGVYTPGATPKFTTSTGTSDVTSSTKFSDIKTLVFGDFAANISSANGFFMTNAVLTTDKATGGSAPAAGNIHILENLTASLYATEAEALSNPAGSIFVERAVAKATLTNSATIIDCTNSKTITNVTWAINNTEPTSYIVRKAHTASLGYNSGGFTTPYYRFVGDAAIGTTAIQPVTTYYRTYWCEDPQYAADAALTRPADAAAAASALKATGNDNPQYCNENTFDVAHQTYNNTTRAIIKVETDGNTTFYTDNGVNESLTLAAVDSRILDIVLNDATFANSVKGCLKAGQSLTLTGDMFTVNWNSKDATGKISVSSITVNESAPGWNWTNGDLWTATDEATRKTDVATAIASAQTSAVAGANVLHTILEYTNGVVYYEARFEHFANTAYEKGLGTYAESAAKTAGDLAPWNCWETSDKPTATTSYPGTNNEQNYLGRYGMVRNNWYDVTITAINKIGLPVDPSITVANPTTPDDDIDDSKYISVKINVLSWAKRTQTWSF